MKTRPILFSGPMVRALLAGTKTQTRRVIKGDLAELLNDVGLHMAEVTDLVISDCPYGKPGDRLWVRETWAQNCDQLSDDFVDSSYVYRADDKGRALDNGTDLPWKPSIHMPRWASRITLEITDVRVQRLQNINEADAIAEGVAQGNEHRVYPSNDAAWVRSYRAGFEKLWDSINGKKYPWKSSPWVWVIEFKRIESAKIEAGLK